MSGDGAGLGGAEAGALAGVVPENPDQLWSWLSLVAGVRVARRALLDGSDAPFDYLVHSFFEGRFSGGGGGGGSDCVVWACRGGGKTFLGAVATMLDLVFKAGVEVRILGGSLEQSGRMHAHLRRLFSRPGLSGLLSSRVTGRRVELRNGSVAEVLAQSQASVRGTRVQKVRCDEVELFDPEVWEAAQLTTGSLGVSGPWGESVRGAVEALSTMHRPRGLMWSIVGGAGEEGAVARRRLFRWGVVDVLERCGRERECVSCGLFDECGGRAKAGVGARGHVRIDDALAMKPRVDAQTWESEMLCSRPTRRDAVVGEFDESVHVIDGVAGGLAGGEWVGGMDFGLRGKTVVLWGHVDGEGVLRVFEERAVSGELLESHVRAIVDGSRPRLSWIGVDPAGAQRSDQTGLSAVSVLRRAGLAVRWRRMGVQEGLSLVRARLRPADGSAARLFVHRRCAELIGSLLRYRYPSDRPWSLEPVKDGSDHAVDALRYLVVNLDWPYRSSVSSYF